MIKLIKSVYHARKYKSAPMTVCGEGTGFNPMINPAYQKLSLANQHIKKSPRIEGWLKRLGII